MKHACSRQFHECFAVPYLPTRPFKTMNGETGALGPTAEADSFEGRPGQTDRILIYPHAGHGIQRFEQKPDGGRVGLGVRTRLLPAAIEWFRQQSGM